MWWRGSTSSEAGSEDDIVRRRSDLDGTAEVLDRTNRLWPTPYALRDFDPDGADRIYYVVERADGLAGGIVLAEGEPLSFRPSR